MRKIVLSLVTIFAAVAMVAGATGAYFADQAVLGLNTYSTGILEIRLNGLENLPGFTVNNAAPGDVATKVFTLSNYDFAHFGGPSTLAAKGLTATAVKTGATNDDLYNALKARLYANAGWGGCSNVGVLFVAGKGCTVYNGFLSGLVAADILHATYWGVHPDLVPGNSFTMTLEVELPDSGDQSALMGKSAFFDLKINGYTSWPAP